MTMWTSSLLNARSVALSAALALLLGAGAGAQDLGQEWRSLGADEAMVLLSGPGLEDSVSRHMRSSDPSHAFTVEVGVWTGPAATHAKALTHFYEASPGKYFKYVIDPGRFVRELGVFDGKSLDFGSLQRARNARGRVKVRRFSFDNVECMCFSQAWNSVEGVGEKQLNGYYCADPGEGLSEETLERVIRDIRFRRRPTS
jgi:hypothetical protein